MDYQAVEMAQTSLLAQMDIIIERRLNGLAEHFQSDLPLNYPQYNEIMLMFLTDTIKDMDDFDIPISRYAPIVSEFHQIIARYDQLDRPLAQKLRARIGAF